MSFMFTASFFKNNNRFQIQSKAVTTNGSHLNFPSFSPFICKVGSKILISQSYSEI